MKRSMLLIGIAGLLAGCSSTGTDDGGGVSHTWSSRTVWEDDGPVTVSSYQTNQVEAPVRGPEWAFQGIWELEEYLAATDRMGEMACQLRLDPAKVTDKGHMLTLIACDGEMSHLASWYPAGTRVILLDANGETVADLAQQGGGRLYRGELVLASKGRMQVFFTGYGR